VIPPFPLIIERAEATTTIELMRKQGKSFYLSGAVNRLMNDEREFLGYLMVVRDVTELRKEEILKRNFLSLISHKLKTPLVTITGYAPLLIDGGANLNDFQKKALHAIKTQGTQLSSLVEKLISFSLVESENLDLQPQKIKIKELLEDSLNN